MASAIEVYQVKFGTYPSQEGWFAALKRSGIVSRNVPEKDPWGNQYVYRPSGDARFDLRSVGPDGALGTEDDQVRANDWAWTGCRGRTGCW